MASSHSMGGVVLLSLMLFASCVSSAEEVKDIEEIDIRFLYIQPGQTLHNIVKRLYSHRKPEWPRLSRQIIEMNPHAFPGGEARNMKAGVRITLPSRHKVVEKKKTEKAAEPIRSVGRVIQTRGQVLVVGDDKQARSVTKDSEIFIGDKIVTGNDGFIKLLMVDEALLDLHCSSIMVIEEYSLSSSDSNGKSVINLLKGSIKKVTGSIGKWKEDVYELKTPIASIGVRGTEYALRVVQSKGCDGTIDLEDDGLYLKVNNGQIQVSNKAGTTEVTENHTLYIPAPESAPEPKQITEEVFEARTEEQKDEGLSWWWYLLGAVLIGASI